MFTWPIMLCQSVISASLLVVTAKAFDDDDEGGTSVMDNL